MNRGLLSEARGGDSAAAAAAVGGRAGKRPAKLWQPSAAGIKPGSSGRGSDPDSNADASPTSGGAGQATKDMLYARSFTRSEADSSGEADSGVAKMVQVHVLAARPLRWRGSGPPPAQGERPCRPNLAQSLVPPCPLALP